MECQKDLELFNIRPYRSKRLKSYSERYSKDDVTVLYDDNVADMLLAQGYSIEESPRSVYKVSKLYEALSKYAPGKIHNPKHDQSVDSGIALAYTCFAKPQDRPYLEILPFTAATISTITSNPSGSAGLTNYGCSKAESQTRALERGLQTLKGQKAPEPCLAFKRTQFNDKTRLVWGYPYSMTAIEGLVAYPLLEVFKGGTTPMAFAMASGALGTKLRVASYHKEWAYSLDMSAFDSSIAGELIHIAFKILRTWYDVNAIEPVSGLTVKQVFKCIEDYFIHTPIVMPDQKLYLGKRHGVPSGSYFTQIVDSIVNVIIGGTISHKFSMHVSKKEIFVLGDDLLMWSNRKMDLDKIAKYVNQTFGVKMHGSEKSERFHFDEAVHYLGRDWPNGLPTLDEPEVLKRMAYSESYRKYPKDPVQKERQVKLLLLSYASVYWSGWSIAHKLLGSDLWYAQGFNRIENAVYCVDHTGEEVQVDPNYLTGLQRYLRKYVHTDRSCGLTTTALQYWL